MRGDHLGMSSARRLGLLWMAAALGGCGRGDWKAETQPAFGEVVINGQPAKGVIVTLHPKGEAVDVRKSRPWGLTNEKGFYTLRTYESGDGAPVGEYQATIVWKFDPSKQEETDRLGFAYSKPEKSEWEVSVGEGENLLPKIELSDVKLQDPPKAKAAGSTPFDIVE